MTDKDIINAASEVCGLDPDKVIRRTRKTTEHVTARIIIAKALRGQGHTLESIREKMNYKDHTSVMHLLDIAKRPDECEPFLAMKMEEAEDIIHAEP